MKPLILLLLALLQGVQPQANLPQTQIKPGQTQTTARPTQTQIKPGKTTTATTTTSTTTITTTARPTVVASTGPSPLAKGLGGLTQSLYLEMVARSGQGNFVFSPLSLHSALAMLFFGTDRKSVTADELKQTLGFKGSRHALGDSYKALISTYSREKSFLYGNAIWVKKGSNLKHKYKKTVTDKLSALVEAIDFNDQAVEKVNSWVKEKTGEKIPSLVQSLPAETRMFLANALYFKEKWKIPFREVKSKTGLGGPFNPLGGSSIEVPMMMITSDQIIYREIRNNGTVMAEVATIPYENPLFEMQIILPTSAENMLILEEKMRISDVIDKVAKTTENPIAFNLFSDMNLIPPKYETEDVYVKMPTFKVKTDLEAAGPLQKLGVKKVFTTQAELGELVDEKGLAVSRIVHKAVVEVTKEGTEGAAATGVQFVLLTLPDEQEFIVDKPFIFVVRDGINKIPILVGKVNDPTK